jgi:carbonic anhydrase
MLPDPTAPPTVPLPAFAPASGAGAHPTAPDPADPDAALAALVAGNRRFAAGSPSHGHRVGAALAAARAPRPGATIVGCMDARVPVEAVFDQDFGALCVARSAGHVVDRATHASVELAIGAFGVRLVVVLGHTRCAAVAAAVAAYRNGRRVPGSVGFVFDEIGRSITGADANGRDHPERVARRHVTRTADALRGSLGGFAGGGGAGGRERSRTGPVRVVGAVYDVDTGRVEML